MIGFTGFSDDEMASIEKIGEEMLQSGYLPHETVRFRYYSKISKHCTHLVVKHAPEK